MQILKVINNNVVSAYNENIPYDHIQIVGRIITMANDLMEHKLSKGIYISLLDHLNGAIVRGKDGIMVENSLLWEIKRFYS